MSFYSSLFAIIFIMLYILPFDSILILSYPILCYPALSHPLPLAARAKRRLPGPAEPDGDSAKLTYSYPNPFLILT